MLERAPLYAGAWLLRRGLLCLGGGALSAFLFFIMLGGLMLAAVATL